MFFLSFLRFRVVSGDSGRAIAPFALVFCSFLPLQNSIHIYDFPLFFVCSESFWMAKKLPNSMPKTFQKSWTNPPQPRQNRCQNLPKSSPRRSKIEVWRGFRWKSLSDPKLSPLFSAPGGRLGASWGRPGASSARLGAVLAPSWASWGRLWRGPLKIRF